MNVGDVAPEIHLPDQNEQMVTLSTLRGKTVVLFFYPKADTPGCTAEACAFRDAQAQFESANTVLLGISPDPVTVQEKFAAKFGLPFRLLADTEHAVAEAYGVWGEKTLAGKKYLGVHRSTFVIAPDGRIRALFPKVKVDGHADEVLDAIHQAASA